MSEYNHTKSIDILSEAMQRNREKVKEAQRKALEAEAQAARRARRARAMVRYGRPAIGLLWRLLVMAGQAVCWILAPIVALTFAQWFVQGLDINSGHGALAAVVTYIVAAVAGIKGAAQASAGIGTFKNNIHI